MLEDVLVEKRSILWKRIYTKRYIQLLETFKYLLSFKR